jgi:phosphate transport system protein
LRYSERSPRGLRIVDMPRKAVTSRIAPEQPVAIDRAERPLPIPKPETAKKNSRKPTQSLDELARTALKAFLIARDAVFNVRDLLTHSSRMAFLAIKECEQELDIIERYIDDRLPAAITRVNEARARQLLTSLKCTTDLERIGDLMMSVAMRVQSRTEKMSAFDVRQLVEMSAILREMLDLVYRGFLELDLEAARKVLQMDKDIDRVCHGLFQKHLTEHTSQNFDVLLMAQAIERAGDHTTNLAEDLYSLIEGRSLRHPPKKKAAT